MSYAVYAGTTSAFTFVATKKTQFNGQPTSIFFFFYTYRFAAILSSRVKQILTYGQIYA